MEPFVPDAFNCYFEPFLGGGAMYFHLNPTCAVVNDLNERLISFYRGISAEPDRVRSELKELQEIYVRQRLDFQNRKNATPNDRVFDENEELYYRIRDMYNHPETSTYSAAAVYFFINKTAYSGMLRYNKQGEYNVPYGRYASFNSNVITDGHVELLKRSTILCGDYRKAFDMATSDDFMFLDPPYDCVFTDYGNVKPGEEFGEAEHRQLAEDFKNLSCKTLLVIGKTPLTMELYGDMVVAEYPKSYAVNIRNRFKSESVHLLIANY